MNQTGVVVVTYNSAEVIGRCLDSCAGLPVIVIDNASTDGTRDIVQRRPAVKLIANASNRGFAAAVNQGVGALKTELVLLLNPDAEIETPVDPMAEACARDGVGAAGGKLIDETGKVQSGFALRRFPTPMALTFEVLGINRMLLESQSPLSLSDRIRPAHRSRSATGSVSDVPARVVATVGRFSHTVSSLVVRRRGFLQAGSGSGIENPVCSASNRPPSGWP
jgi:GT2 family glycosyltransferase